MSADTAPSDEFPPLPGEPGKPLQFWKYDNHNCSVATWLCIMEVVLHVSRVCVLPSQLLSNVFADRRKLVHGEAAFMLGVFHEFCINKYRKQSTPAVDDAENPLLPYVYYADLPLFLGQGTAALAAFSCVKLKTVPVGTVHVNTAKIRLLQSTPRPAIISVFPNRNETVADRMSTFFSHVFGDLPQLVHLDVAGFRRLEAIDPFIVLSVPRLDHNLVPRATTVTYKLAAAACQNGSHYNAIVVGADGLHWDYDCIGSGQLVQRAFATQTSAKPGYYFKSIIYRLVSEARINVACHVESSARTCDPCAPTPKLHRTTKTPSERTQKIPGVCKRKNSARIVGDEAAPHELLCSALQQARTAQRPIGLKGQTARTLDFGGSASVDLGAAAGSAMAPAAVKMLKRRHDANDNLACAPADPRVLSLRAPTMPKSWVEKNLQFLRDCTGEHGYLYVDSPTGAAGMAALEEDAHFLASRVLFHVDHTAHGVHQPGRPNKPDMWYFNYGGDDSGGRNTARITPASREPACVVAHDKLLKHAMRGTLQGHVDAGVAKILHTGFLCENIDVKCTRDKGVRNPEKYTRVRQYSDGSLSKDRRRTDATRLFDDSCGAEGFAWRYQTVLKRSKGALGACHVDSCNHVNEAVVVVIITLTEHGGGYTYTSCILFFLVNLIHAEHVLFCCSQPSLILCAWMIGCTEMKAPPTGMR